MTRLFSRSARADVDIELRKSEILAEDPLPELTLAAHRRWESAMNAFNPTPVSAVHAMLGLKVLSGFTRQAIGDQRQRLVYPVQTGMGKTQAAVAWVAALADLSREDDYPVAIVAGQVEELIKILRLLVAAGVPRAKIGLRHEKRFDPTRCDPTNVPHGYASEPADTGATSRPILLATHARALGKKAEEVPKFKGRARRLTIWDESLIATQAMSICAHEFVQLTSAIWQFLDDSKPLYKFLRDVEGILKKEIAGRKSGDSASALFALTIHTTDAKDEIRRLRNSRIATSLCGVLDQIEDLIDLLSSEMAVVGVDDDTVFISVRTVLPDSLDSIAILDASYPIRDLCNADPTIKPAFDPDPSVKSYRRVTVNQLRIGAGRQTVERDLRSGRRSKYRRLIMSVARQIPATEALMILTYRQRGPKGFDFVEAIRRTLRDSGIDPDETLPAEGGRRRINIVTWGNETSTSEHRHCRYVLFVGVQHRSLADLAACISAQRRNLLYRPTTDEVKIVRDSEVAQGVYQAVNRGAARMTENGEALEMTVYLPLRGDDIRARLSQVMPGLQWETWRTPDVLQERKAAMVALVAAHLSNTPPESAPIWTARIKAQVPKLQELHHKQARIVIELGAAHAGWQVIKKSVVPRRDLPTS